MGVKSAFFTTLAGAVLIAAPAYAGDSGKMVERKCEIRIENGKETRTGDCDGVDAKNIHVSKGDGKEVRVEIQTDGDGGGAHKMMWVGDGGQAMDFAFGPDSDFLALIGDVHKDWDTNGDGEISKDEIRAAKKKELAEYDRNRDGKLSLDEYKQLWMARNNARMVDDFQDLDEDGDAKVTLDEFTNGANRHVFIRKMIKNHVTVHEDD